MFGCTVNGEIPKCLAIKLLRAVFRSHVDDVKRIVFVLFLIEPIVKKIKTLSHLYCYYLQSIPTYLCEVLTDPHTHTCVTEASVEVWLLALA